MKPKIQALPIPNERKEGREGGTKKEKGKEMLIWVHISKTTLKNT